MDSVKHDDNVKYARIVEIETYLTHRFGEDRSGWPKFAVVDDKQVVPAGHALERPFCENRAGGWPDGRAGRGTRDGTQFGTRGGCGGVRCGYEYSYIILAVECVALLESFSMRVLVTNPEWAARVECFPPAASSAALWFQRPPPPDVPPYYPP